MSQKFFFQLSLEEAEGCFKKWAQQALLQLLHQGQGLSLASPNPSKEEDVITIADVCKLFKISRPTVNDWMKTNKLPYRRIGRRVYFIRQEILAALQSFNRRAK
ncbi:helix-turn-helix domain-containing protein [Adhaeribacter soli]|uniref:Helix-turn-helix domain-containing protein n=1 Tax=Adhaeribacter soli TaxID=2607655 RepID=A0A5N1IWY6_9BACT|nr:helix-turn-helix domain-containing protein [Adhaeribacter soli]KAA9338804.1 helix-turn-helix domain-containing protein [Adhaeribacter soli]